MFRKLASITLMLFLAVGFLMSHTVFAGTAGKISGTVVNEETGEPLPGVAVSIVGTKMGALTNPDGEYYILNVPVGDYTLKASLIGFAPVEVVNLDVSVDLTTYQDFSLSKKALELGKTIVVTAERPLVIKDKTASIKVVEAEEIQNMPTRGYEQIVGLQAGVVRFRDNPNTRQRGARQSVSNSFELNIRGGRSSEVAYFVDGFSQQDPLSGISTTNINNNALQEIELQTGGFSAEYGWVASGIVNVTTREGSQEYSGAVEAVTDNILSGSYDYNVYDANIGGPIPGLDGSTFFVSGERRWQGDRQPSAVVDDPLPYNWLSGWTGQGKLSLKLNENMNFKLGGMYSRDLWQEYRHAYYFIPQHTPKYEDENSSIYGKWTHTLSPKTFYSAAVSLFSTYRFRGDGIHFDDFEAYYRPRGNPNQDESGLFWSWDDINDTTNIIYATVDGPDYYYTDSVDAGGGLWDYTDSIVNPAAGDTTGLYDPGRQYTLSGDESHVWDDYLKRKSSYIGVDFDFTSQVTPRHLVKAGFDFQRHTLRYYRHLFPTNPGDQSADRYGYDANAEESDDEDWRNETKHPITMAIFAQDKFEWNDLVINAGLRWDYFDTRAKEVIDIEAPFGEDGTTLDEEDLKDSEAEYRLSPRIGVAFPVSDKTVMHLSYGLFFQRPQLQNLYVGYDYYELKVNRFGYYYPFGNPSLEPEKTTAYEFGISHQLGDNTAFEITAFYKDIKNLTQVANLPATPKAYQIYFNNDFGTVKGLDFTLKMRRVKSIMLDLNYALSWAKGTGSFAATQNNIAWTLSEAPVQTAPLLFDMRHKFTGIIDVRAGKGQGPAFGDIYPLENAGLNLVFNLSSGTPYSPMENDVDAVTLYSVSYTPAAPVNSRYSDWKFRVDLKANKTVQVAGFNMDFYVWVLNLFDQDNVIAVYETSGSANNTTYLATDPGEEWLASQPDELDSSGLTRLGKYNLKQNDPINYDVPRQVRFGIRMSF